MICPSCDDDVDDEELEKTEDNPMGVCSSCRWDNYDSGTWDFETEDAEC